MDESLARARFLHNGNKYKTQRIKLVYLKIDDGGSIASYYGIYLGKWESN